MGVCFWGLRCWENLQRALEDLQCIFLVSHGCSRLISQLTQRLKGLSAGLSGWRPWSRDGQGRKAGEW